MEKDNEIIDISILLNEKTPVYPGNPKVEIKHFTSASGQSFNSQILLGSHVGTHIDAPAHALSEGKKIQDFPLDYFVGGVRVLDLSTSKNSISLVDIKGKSVKKGERILLKTTNSSRGFTHFYDDYVFLSPEAAHYIAEKEIRLLGIDSFSVKQKGSSDNRPHTEILSKNIPIIEGIDLAEVAEGAYFLIALPLAVETDDAAPARVVLLK